MIEVKLYRTEMGVEPFSAFFNSLNDARNYLDDYKRQKAA